MLQDSLESFSQARRDTLALLQDLSQQQLDYKPSPAVGDLNQNSKRHAMVFEVTGLASSQKFNEPEEPRWNEETF